MKVLRPESNTYGAPFGVCKSYKKALKNFQVDEDVWADDQMIEYSGKWGILDKDNEILVPLDYDFIDFFRNETQFKVAIGNVKIDYEKSLQSYKASKVKWGVINIENKVLIPCEYDWIEELEKGIYAVNLDGELKYNNDHQEEYWFAENGKWGVLNSNNEVIIPIEYDSFFISWGKVKEVIFVQKGKPYFDENEYYDGYDYFGNLVYKNIKGSIKKEYRHS